MNRWNSQQLRARLSEEAERRASAEASAAEEGSKRSVTVEADLEPEYTNLESRYAQALADEPHPSEKADRDELGHAEGIYPPKAPFGAHTGSPLAMDSRPGSPDTADSFDWDETDSSDEEEVAATREAKAEEDKHRHRHNIKRAKRLRKVYLACIRISRPVRTLMLAGIGSGLLMVPAVICWTVYKGPSANVQVRDNLRVWSIWLTVIWASSCGTSIFVDMIPWLASKISILLTGLYSAEVKDWITMFDGAKFWLKCLLISVWAWIGLSVLSDHIYTADYLDYFSYILSAVQAIFGSCLVLYGEKLIVQSVKASFHQNALKDRIEENARALWAIDKLAVSKKHNKRGRNPFRNTASNFRNSALPTPVPSRPGSRSASPVHMKSAQRGIEHTVEVPLTPLHAPTSLAAKMRQRTSKPHHEKSATDDSEPRSADSPELGKSSRSDRSGRRRANSKTIAEQLAEALAAATLKDKSRYTMSTTHSAKRMARRLFEGLHQDRDVLLPADFTPYFPSRADAEAAFALFDKDGNGDISKREMRSAVQRIYRERKALKASLADMGSAVKKLDSVMLGVWLIIVLFIFFLIFKRTNTVSTLTSISTIVAALSFVFSNSASTLFNSMIFIFSTQPYSIGDLVFIDNDALVVKEFGLMSTIFERVDGQYIVAPNAMLSTQKHILNVQRSGSMWETTSIHVGIDTPLEILNDLRARMRAYVADNSREWGGGLDLNINTIKEMNAIECVIALQHRSNWQNWGGRWNRRTQLMKHLKTVLDELGVNYKLPPQPVHLQVRGGQSPFLPRDRMSAATPASAHPSQASNAFGLRLDTRYLSADALGNAGRVSGLGYGSRSFPRGQTEIGSS